ncbi:DUF4349 domain-containing protein [Streptomyces sp. DSM 44915]|uniref:DUF4349 domain-containing protein n=1 Tax=Streptomyces chisholmiae TaxID=3075540 RepID=A0ABU2JMS2_9ACTN|nr:DUF4349 domain-containing protein [Streptomyces sp. DSM 44915]MDT0266291.1 DUF4349 domain-containing protein [Streptomyces sp. DSM 44915]
MRERTAEERRRRWPVLTAALTGAVLLAGCTSSGDTDEGAGSSEAAADWERGVESAAPEAGGEQAEAEDTGEPAAVAEVPDPGQLIQSATLTLTVDAVPDAYAEAVRLAQTTGGYVSHETTSGGEAGTRSSTLTLRVPSEAYPELLAALPELGELTARELTTEDVGDEIVDLDSRLATQRESIARVRALMEDAGSLAEIVQLESELSTRQAELESLEARRETLRGQTALATVTLQLHEEGQPLPEPEESDDDDRPSVLDALLGGLGFVWTVLVWAAIGVGAALPVAALLALLWLLWRLLRRRLPDRPRRSGVVAPAPVTTPPPLPRPTQPPAQAPAPAGDGD